MKLRECALLLHEIKKPRCLVCMLHEAIGSRRLNNCVWQSLATYTFDHYE